MYCITKLELRSFSFIETGFVTFLKMINYGEMEYYSRSIQLNYKRECGIDLRYPFFNSDELLVLLELLVPVKRLMLIIEEKYDWKNIDAYVVQ